MTRPRLRALGGAAMAFTTVLAVVLVMPANTRGAGASPELTGCEGELVSLDADGAVVDRASGAPPHDVVDPDDDTPTLSKEDPLRVEPGGTVRWRGRSTATITDQRWRLSVWGLDLLSGSSPNDGDAVVGEGTLDVDDALPAGFDRGLARVDATLVGSGGRCDAAGWVRVDGRPWLRPAWLVALVLVAGGVALAVVAQPKQVPGGRP
ncbi:MAG: hypothetical protein U5R31_06520 [Acidimicrobiia bacterium]|nr:hypothetical protein [Acidimicrobiia bacterium]